MKVGILNVTGYAGAELARLLSRHPGVKLAGVTGRSQAGGHLSAVYPHLADLDLPIEAALGEVDFVFSALPHRASAEALLPWLQTGKRVVDVSADFRLQDPQEYQAWYGVPHPAPQLLEEAVYGLTELVRRQLPQARLVANPGCYPTAAILALAPALAEGLIEPDLIIDAKSGVSGAGRTLDLMTHYSEVNENTQAYGLEGHRHLPEITQELGKLAPNQRLSVTFVPHLVPMTRGILTTCYARLRSGPAEAEVQALYQEYYADEPFVRVVEAPPQTKHTWGNNLCLLYPIVDPRTQRLIVVSCLDNLVKGAAGQAIQNMNVMCGFPETWGLEALAVYP